jgi:dTDP-4-dehydrorhamnose reductase
MGILVTGTDGFVGGRLLALAPDALGLGRAAGDVAEIGPAIRARRPDAVIHLAAISGTATCEADPAEAKRVNVGGTLVVARAASAVGARLVLVTTDQVFDGTAAPYREDDPPTPISVYGATKAEAERVARSECGDAAIVVRLHLVVGRAVPPRRSGTDRTAEAARGGEGPTLFEDEWRTPIHVADAARALLELAGSDVTGVLHLGGPERLSRLEIGRAVLRAAGLDPDLARVGSIRGFPGPPRAPDTSFDTALAREVLETSIRPIEAALREDFA